MIKRTGKTKTIYVTVFVLLLLYSLSLILPFLVVVFNSFKSFKEYITSIFAIPKELITSGQMFENYLNLFMEYDIVQMLINTLILTVGGIIVGTLSPTIMAYILGKFKFKFNTIIYYFAIVFMMIPSVGTMVSTLKLFYQTNLINTHLGVLCLYAAPFNSYFFVMLAYFRGLSPTYAEAAYMDGANDFTIFFKIVLPISKSGLFSIALLVGMNCWNDYLNPYMYMPDVKTLSTGLQELSLNVYGADILKLFAAMVFMTIPVLIVFFLNGNKIIENVAAGGIKE